MFSLIVGGLASVVGRGVGSGVGNRLWEENILGCGLEFGCNLGDALANEFKVS